MKTKTVSSDQARARWRELLDTAVTGDHVIIERYGKPVAVLIPYQDYVEKGVVKEETAVYRTDNWQLLKSELAAEIKSELLAEPDIQQALLYAELMQLQKQEQKHLEEEFANYEQQYPHTEVRD
ncbi:MAG: type II toxin-antitoxin system Phd/YefM family antitoxin [Ardenticatenaceae bacterium]|nr:type II toxin-antitoxin system Phd/YefM family antitoxin [Ardenticatenaceae bacterium]MCB9446691.1 type II toxin-antitoxin system Phd/YefM family antitoxin [Ardenticatenaceae bacterium]